jgi:hypothetical protein
MANPKASRTSHEPTAYLTLKRTLQSAHDLLNVAKELADDIVKEADQHKAKSDELVRKHLQRTDLRPHVNFKPQPNNTWTVAFNDTIYVLGPYDPIPLDEDNMPFWWALRGSTTKHSARSMFMALMGVVIDYCNQPEALLLEQADPKPLMLEGPLPSLEDLEDD